MTYREAIQKKIEDVEKIYDHAGGLRDRAADAEKQTWNDVRTLSREISFKLQRMDNSLSDGRAGMKVADGY